jgi:hypothetical protein
MEDAVRIQFADGPRRGVGTRFLCVTKIGPITVNDSMTVTEWIDHHVISVAHKGLFKGSGTFTLEAIGPDWTKVTWRESLEFPLLFARGIGEAIASPILRSVWRKNLGRLESTITTNTERKGSS